MKAVLRFLLDFRNNSVRHQEQWGKFLLPDDFFQLTDCQIDPLMKLKARIHP